METFVLKKLRSHLLTWSTYTNLCIHIVNQCRNLGTYVLNVIIDYPLCEKDFLYIEETQIMGKGAKEPRGGHYPKYPVRRRDERRGRQERGKRRKLNKTFFHSFHMTKMNCICLR